MALLSRRRSRRWAEGAIVYQVYPRSFYDSNADGIGDIPGVTAKLPYLKSLQVNAIWLSPFYPSPMADFGYDVADYCNVDPIFGTLADMDELIKKAHRSGIRIIVDLVTNHTSDEHEWFRQSKQSRQGPYADWYIWRDPKGFNKKKEPVPPNNWLDIFTGESAWEWEPARQQFYLHSFDVRQPDLNWANPAVREAMKKVMRFWLDRGVDGFRVDAVRFMGKDPTFQDNPKNPAFKKGWSKYSALLHTNSQGWPQLYGYLNGLAAVLREPKYRSRPRFMVTESYPEEPIEEYLAHYHNIDASVAAPFIFEGLKLPWEAAPWREFLARFHGALDAFSPLCVPSYAFGNHDQWRLVTRLGEARARAVAVLLLTLPGMAFVYNGDEIGMENGEIPPELVQDPGAADGGGRDPERTPMQWSAAKNAGFSAADMTWLPVAEGYQQRNVSAQSRDPHSFLNLYRALGQLRRRSPALKRGRLEVLESGSKDVLMYRRIAGRKSHVVVINFTDKPVEVKPAKLVRLGKLQVSSLAGRSSKKEPSGNLGLRPYEAVVFSGR